MADINQNNQNEEKEVVKHESKLSFNDQVLAKIAAITTREVNGILSMSGSFFSGLRESLGGTDVTKGVSVDTDKNDVIVNLELVMEYGQSAPQIFEQLKEKIAEKVRFMTGMTVVETNVRVVDILSREEFEGKNEEKKK